MPLKPGDSRKVVSNNIAEMIHAGYPQRQAVAASLSNARRHPATHKARGGVNINPRIPTSGYLDSQVAGRTDRLPMSVESDSYVIPADIVSGIGQGNSTAGARMLDEAFKHGPWGTEIGHGGGRRGGMGIPNPPRAAPQEKGQDLGKMVGPIAQGLGAMGQQSANIKGLNAGDLSFLIGNPGMASGGKPKAKAKKVAIAAAGGEYIVPSHIVLAIGHGDSKAGHKLLHAMVEKIRHETIKKLKSLPGPKR